MRLSILFCFTVLFLVSCGGNKSTSVAQVERKAEYEEVKEYVDTNSFEGIDRYPMYRGGKDGIFEEIQKTLRYPEEAKEKDESGEVKVRFTIDLEGRMTDFRIDESPSESLSKESIRVLRKLGGWKPGMKDDKPIKVEMVVPLRFKLK